MALCIDLQYITTFGLSSLDKNKVKRKQFSIDKGTWAKMIVKIHGSILSVSFLLLFDKFTVNFGFGRCSLLPQNNQL